MKEKRLLWKKEMMTVVALNTSIPGKMERTPSHFSWRENNRLPNPYDKSGPAYICARTRLTLHGQTFVIKAGAKNRSAAITEKRIP